MFEEWMIRFKELACWDVKGGGYAESHVHGFTWNENQEMHVDVT